jgi:hypothetical protein
MTMTRDASVHPVFFGELDDCGPCALPGYAAFEARPRCNFQVDASMQACCETS